MDDIKIVYDETTQKLVATCEGYINNILERYQKEYDALLKTTVIDENSLIIIRQRCMEKIKPIQKAINRILLMSARTFYYKKPLKLQEDDGE